MTKTEPESSAPIRQTLAGFIAAQIEAGHLNDDPAQREPIVALDALLDSVHASRLATKKGALGWLFGKSARVAAEPGQRGVYLWGGVGRGKSMLMDAFFALAPEGRKRRVHFHAFMLEVHGRIHGWRQENKKSDRDGADPIPPLAASLADEMGLLCLDEFSVNDVADAMILARLFTALFEQGVRIVATSNTAPDDLYEHGLNRSWFLPFIELVKTDMQVVHLDTQTDYRMQKLSGSRVWFEGDDRAEQFEQLWKEMSNGLVVSPATLEVGGREHVFDDTCGGMVRASFDDLCRKPLGPADYLAMAERFHTLFLVDIPIMEIADRNAAKRFISLIDTWYDRSRVMVGSADAQPDALYPVTHGTEAKEFKRTISRLQEMQSADWLTINAE